MMKGIEHIGIAVNSLDVSIPQYEQLLGVPCYKKEEVESEGVITAFFKLGNVKIELLQATRPDSPISKFIEKRGEGIHHLAFDVQNIKEESARLQENQVRLINAEPKNGADNKLINFLHPKDTGSVLMEICQEK